MATDQTPPVIDAFGLDGSAAIVTGARDHTAATSRWSTSDSLTRQDVLGCGNDAGAKAVIMELGVPVTGKAGVDADNLRTVEPLTAGQINLNGVAHTYSGVAVTSVPPIAGASE